MVSLKIKILTEEKFWFSNFTKDCLQWFAKLQSWSTNHDSWIPNSNLEKYTIDLAIKKLHLNYFCPFQLFHADENL